MALVEIIPTAKTSKETLATTYQLALKLGKTPIVVKDVPGFFVNRCLGPYMDEAIALLLDGADIQQIDRAMTNFGFPVGPMSLVDEVGIDVAASVGKNLLEDLGSRVGAADPRLLDDVLAAGMKGRKTGKGMFVYPKGGKKTINPDMVKLIEEVRAATNRKQMAITDEDVQQRMSVRFMNEAALCIQDEIIDNPTAGNVASVFGIGYPPNRGGVFRHIDSLGAAAVVDTMKRYQQELGDQFAPAPILEDYAKQNKKFL
jgi:enoyl-CoA hydratase/long-chain 3-hydroxyacyl-CoA dehydrogenase